MAKPGRAKTQAVAVPVPQTRDEAVQSVSRLGTAQRTLRKLEAEMNDALAGIKEQFEERANPLRKEIDDLTKGVSIWAEANRDELTGGGVRKTATLGSGELRWRLTPSKVTVRGVEVVIELLKKAGLERFLRLKEEVNKEAILADPEAVKGMPGIKVEQAEEFIIVPFEAELAE